MGWEGERVGRDRRRSGVGVESVGIDRRRSGMVGGEDERVGLEGGVGIDRRSGVGGGSSDRQEEWGGRRK